MLVLQLWGQVYPYLQHDKDIADKVYIEPLTIKVLEHIIEKEKPDSILPTLGGQAGLNLGMELINFSPPFRHDDSSCG